jgi:hypothetical protein
MSFILLVEQTAPQTPSANQVVLYPKSDGVMYSKDDTGTERIVSAFGNTVRTNAIIGGDFSTNPWQRGTSFAAIATAAYSADRWVASYVTGGVVTVTQTVDAPTVAQAGRLTNHCLMIDCTTTEGALVAGDVFRMSQAVEGYNFFPLAQRAMILSFWHKHTKTGTYCVSVRNSGLDRSYVAEYTQAVTDTWELTTITISASPSAGTWVYTTGVGLWVDFTVLSGSTFQTTANAWQTGNFSATANQVNGLDNTANNFRIALVQLEAGSVATEFESRTFNEEMALCQRYYNKTYDDGTTPGTSTPNGSFGFSVTGTAAGTGIGYRQFPVSMRTTPTLTFYSPTSGTAGQGYRNTGAADVAVNNGGIAASQTGGILTNNGTVTDTEIITVHVVASAEL